MAEELKALRELETAARTFVDGGVKDVSDNVWNIIDVLDRLDEIRAERAVSVDGSFPVSNIVTYDVDAIEEIER